MKACAETVVVCAILERDGALLAAKRAAQAYHAGLWELPGGKVEAGETFEQALQRELVEELGIEVSVGEELAVSVYACAGSSIELRAFKCNCAQGTPQAREHQELRWVEPTEALRLPWAPADQPIVAAYAERRRCVP